MNAECLKAVTDSSFFLLPGTGIMLMLIGIIIGWILATITAGVANK